MITKQIYTNYMYFYDKLSLFKNSLFRRHTVCHISDLLRWYMTAQPVPASQWSALTCRCMSYLLIQMHAMITFYSNIWTVSMKRAWYQERNSVILSFMCYFNVSGESSLQSALYIKVHRDVTTLTFCTHLAYCEFIFLLGNVTTGVLKTRRRINLDGYQMCVW